jgi:hypothetical protein
MLLCWSVAVLAIGYFPVRYQRRFSLGLGPALAVLAVVGWDWAARSSLVQRWWRRGPARVILTALLILLLWGQNVLFYSAQVRSYTASGPTPGFVYQPRVLADAAAYIDAWGDGTVVLTCEDLGNMLAGQIAGRVVLGHAGATLDVELRRKEVSSLMTGILSQQAQQALLQEYGATHILTTTVESLTCGPDYIQGPNWSLGFDQGGMRVYARSP